MPSNNSSLSLELLHSLADDEWTRPALASCPILAWIGSYLCVIFILGIVLNGIVLYTLLKTKQLHSPINTFMIALSLADLLHAVCGIPLPLTSSFACRWLYGKYLCYFEGFVAYFVALIGLYLLTALSLNRYWLIVTPKNTRCIGFRTTYISIFSSIIVSFFWAIMPIFGWNNYTLEGALTSCSIHWQDRTVNVISYNVLMFIFVYTIPLSIMVYCNIKIYLQVRDLARRRFSLTTGSTVIQSRLKQKIEGRVFKTVSLITLAFVLAWTPYAIVAFISSFLSPTLVSPLGGTLPAIFAKSSIYINPLIFMITNSQLHSAILNRTSTPNETTSSKDKSTPLNSTQMKLLEFTKD